MENKFQTKQQDKFFNLVTELDLYLVEKSAIKLEKTEENKEAYEKIISIQKEEYGKSITYNNKVVLVNKLLIATYIYFEEEYATKFKKEIELNIRKSEKKHIALNYIETLIYKLEKILDNFYYDEPRWVTEMDNLSFLYYNITFYDEMRYKHKNIGDESVLAPHITTSMQDFLEHLFFKIKDMMAYINLSLKRIKNIPESEFKEVKSDRVLALYYYFMFEANILDNFDRISANKNITKVNAMKYLLEKDGHKYSDYFKNIFYAIKKGTKNDPFEKKHIKSVLRILTNSKAIEIAENELYELNK